jgi:LysM repeat protein
LDRVEEQSLSAPVHSDSKVISYFRRMPLQWLVSRLSNTQLVENGFTQRDLALASLIAFHAFDVDRAFAGLPTPSQKRTIAYGTFRDGSPAELIVYPGLSDKYFQAALTFAATERWPLTPKGLFLALQRGDREEEDMSLQDAFFMTPEFASVEMLFSRGEVRVGKEELLKALLEGNWEQLADFAGEQKASHDLSGARRQGFLLGLVQNKSKAAARLFLKTDGAHMVRKLDDAQVLALLELMGEKSEEGEAFALAMLDSPRSDAVRKTAAARLYEYEGGVLPQSYSHQEAVAHFIKKEVVVPKTVTKAPSLAEAKPLPPVRKASLDTAPTPRNNERYYAVQEGDSLWRIARRFGVDIDALRQSNKLESDVLRPGKVLKIPASR